MSALAPFDPSELLSFNRAKQILHCGPKGLKNHMASGLRHVIYDGHIRFRRGAITEYLKSIERAPELDAITLTDNQLAAAIAAM